MCSCTDRSTTCRRLQNRWCYKLTTSVLLFLLWATCAGAETILRCVDELGPMNSHDEAMEALNGKRIFFVGDSITRYQYLELAYFAAHKRCPDPTGPLYVLSEAWFQGWDDFYASVSARLEVETDTHRTSEMSMAARLLLRPLRVCEHRTFHYEDAKGRSFDLVYQQYFDETFSHLRTALGAASAVAATDVVFNFGVWLRNHNASCGVASDGTPCPSVDWVCDFIHSTQHTFRVWWLATTPYAMGSRVVQKLPRGHPMNMQFVCGVPRAQLVDRVAVLAALEPDPERRPLLWWSADGPHFHADANHGFNQALWHRLARAPAPGKRSWLSLPWAS